MRRVCIVTDEFYPVKPGGIGRVLNNLLTSFPSEAEIHLLMMRTGAAELEQLNDLFGPRLRFHGAAAHPNISTGYGPDFATVSMREPAPLISALDESRAVLYGLLALASQLHVEFDVVEFPDFRGWAYSAIQEKRSGLAFSRTLIAVRLHTTQSIIDWHEEKYASHDLNNCALKELERLALRDADLIVGHAPSVPRATQEHFQFADAWLAKTVCERLPILPLEGAVPVPPLTGARDIVFSGRLAPVKEVALFVRAACQVLREEPSWTGDVILACGGWQNDYIQGIKNLVPQDLRLRVVWRPDLDHKTRTSIIQNSVFVMPSRYEGCCLAVYEASLAGAVVVLNAACPAFDDHSPWIDDHNCLKFTGGSQALATVLKKAIRSQPLEQVDVSGQRPYFESAAFQSSTAALEPDAPAKPTILSVVIHIDDNAEHIAPTVNALLAIEALPLQVIFVDDASAKPETARLIDYYRWRLHSRGQTEWVRLPVKHGRANAFREGWERAKGAAVAFLEAGGVPDARAYAAHARALAANLVDVVFPTVGGMRDLRDLGTYTYDRITLAGTGGLPILDTYSWAPASPPILRRAAFASCPFDTEIEDFEFLDFGLRWADRVRIAATSCISLNIWNPRQVDAAVVASARSAKSLRRLLAHLNPSGRPAPREAGMAVARSLALLMPWAARMEARGEAEAAVPAFVPAFIRVAGRVNPLGLGQEVWLLGWRDSGGQSATANSMKMSGSWKLENNNALKSSEIGASLTVQLDLTSGETPHLKFLSHPWSGAVEVSIGRFSGTIDLFGAETTERIVEIPLDAI